MLSRGLLQGSLIRKGFYGSKLRVVQASAGFQQGPKDGSAATNVAGGNAAWQNPTNILTGLESTVRVGDGEIADSLTLTGLSFNAPVGAKLVGFATTVWIRKTAGNFSDLQVGWTADGTTALDSVVISGDFSSTVTAITVRKMMSQATTIWTIAQVNGANFGTQISVAGITNAQNDAAVSRIRLCVSFTL